MIDKLLIQRLEATPIEGVAERLGLDVNRHKCLCPFHDDSRPSLTFNTYKNRYRCFVCDAHGGVIDLVKNCKNLSFREACTWLDSGIVEHLFPVAAHQSPGKKRRTYPLDLDWLSCLVRTKVLTLEARRFLFDERHIDPRVVAWCGLTSISAPQPCWRYGKPFYDAPSLLIPYYDIDGRLVSVQGRYLGNISSQQNQQDIPRFKFPRGSDCHIYGLQILRMLRPGEELWITEGASDCWAMLSSGKKAIAIPSATLLKDKDVQTLLSLSSSLSLTLHMYPDQDRPGEKLFLDLRERLPQLQRHQLPDGCKDFGDYWQRLNVKS